jgi:hypothetical protein
VVSEAEPRQSRVEGFTLRLPSQIYLFTLPEAGDFLLKITAKYGNLLIAIEISP